jgi:16S rRNA (guanine527-N7)-methyltransferase
MVNTSDETLAAALDRHGIEIAPPQIERLEHYCRLLWEWNEKLNLTRHTDYEKFVTRDLVDSLALAKQLEPGERLMDVGTGGGVPGVILAVVREDIEVTLCESVAKKARAITDIVRQLGLPVDVLHGRAEDLLGSGLRMNTLVIRAVARLRKLLTWFRPRLQFFDRMLLVKGPAWVEERGEARHVGLLKNLELRRLAAYDIPGSEAKSVVLQICHKQKLLPDDRCRLTEWKNQPSAKDP